MKRPLVITMGDPAGVGPEVIAKALAVDSLGADCVVVGDPAVMERASALVCAELEINAVSALEDRRGVRGVMDVLPVGNPAGDIPVGAVSARAGRQAYLCIERAIELCDSGRARALVTAPINKEAFRAAGIPYPGHTEMLADKTGTEHVAMMLANHELCVVLNSVHVPLREAIQSLTVEGVLRTVSLAMSVGPLLGKTSPRLAVAGINPHASENGLFGSEEREILSPAIEQAVRSGIAVTGPWSPDTVFMRARAGEFDAVIAMYHDQGLIPIKYLGLDEGINTTLGLPFIRTSVDHGTAFDIAGSGCADPRSLIAAIKAANQYARAKEKQAVTLPAGLTAASLEVEPA